MYLFSLNNKIIIRGNKPAYGRSQFHLDDFWDVGELGCTCLL